MYYDHEQYVWIFITRLGYCIRCCEITLHVSFVAMTTSNLATTRFTRHYILLKTEAAKFEWHIFEAASNCYMHSIRNIQNVVSARRLPPIYIHISYSCLQHHKVGKTFGLHLRRGCHLQKQHAIRLLNRLHRFLQPNQGFDSPCCFDLACICFKVSTIPQQAT